MTIEALRLVLFAFNRVICQLENNPSSPRRGGYGCGYGQCCGITYTLHQPPHWPTLPAAPTSDAPIKASPVQSCRGGGLLYSTLQTIATNRTLLQKLML